MYNEASGYAPFIIGRRDTGGLGRVACAHRTGIAGLAGFPFLNKDVSALEKVTEFRTRLNMGGALQGAQKPASTARSQSMQTGI